jgi:glucose/arabinose dehydrogenase
MVCRLAAALAGIALVAFAGAARAAEAYATAGDCDGFPRVHLETQTGACVGLVATHLGFARGVAAIGPDVYVADMGGWHKGRGRLLKLGDHGKAAAVVLLKGLDEPNALALGPGGSLYVGMLGKIIRVDPGAADPAGSVRNIVTGLPVDGRHPLAALAVAPDGSLFVNVGSATDHCEHDDSPPDPAKACPETVAPGPRGVILHLMPANEPVDARTLAPFARGLRNSMALAIAPSGSLIAAVNARDAIDQADPSLSDADLPHDTFDRVEQGADYGWPYCFDNNRPSPEYPRFDCTAKHAPSFLLPPHAAPLGMLIYRGASLAGLDRQAIIALHGYRDQGHRLVALSVDADGQPSGQIENLISGWDVKKGDHPQGAPVGVFEQPDGSILITEDHNGTLLRLAPAR